MEKKVENEPQIAMDGSELNVSKQIKIEKKSWLEFTSS